MARDIPISNGRLLVAFDDRYRIRDLYYPDVGGENHVGGHCCRTALWEDGRCTWLDDDGWRRQLDYHNTSLVTRVTLRHEGWGLELTWQDAVDRDLDVLVRRLRVRNLRGQARRLRLFLHHNLHVRGYDLGLTALYDARTHAVCHYKGPRWLVLSGRVGEAVGPVQWACGPTAEQTVGELWRDAEDGELSGQPVHDGTAESVARYDLEVPAGGETVVWFWLAASTSPEGAAALQQQVLQQGPEHLLQRTIDYWRLWAHKDPVEQADLSDDQMHVYYRSLLITRAHCDRQGGIVAAADTDIVRFGQDVYSYVWMRDASLAAAALIEAGYHAVPTRLFDFCAKALEPEGYYFHKYNPDGSFAASWHPWSDEGGEPRLPIQEDETALVLWALWRYYRRFRDVELIEPFYESLVVRAADFLDRFRHPETRLPYPSFDLWERRFGVHTFTVAAVIAGLESAARFAYMLGDRTHEGRYRQAVAELYHALDRYLWSAEHRRYIRTGYPEDGGLRLDTRVEAANYALFAFDVLDLDSPRLRANMQAIVEDLRIHTDIGGYARFTDDYYHQVSHDLERIPGNPWFITALWVAQWHLAVARTRDDLAPARELLGWCVEHAYASSVMPEQLHPETGECYGVSPLVWSHAEYVTTVLRYGRRYRELADR